MAQQETTHQRIHSRMRITCRRAFQFLRGLPRGAAAYLLLLFSRRVAVAGMELVDATGDSTREADNRIARALSLIETTLPAVHRRLLRDVRRIVLIKAGGPEYWPVVDAIALTKGVVERAEVALLGMTLVHEGVHARLWRRGIGYPRQMRARIEHLCVSAEVRLARALPDAEELEAFAKEKLTNEWWSEAAVRSRTSRARAALRE